MKTALQELIENLESNIKGCETALIDNIEKEFVKGIQRALEDVKIDLENALIKEKEQITKTWNDCKLSIIFNEPKDSEEYYNKTYNQNK
jgi:hypothetical protein